MQDNWSIEVRPEAEYSVYSDAPVFIAGFDDGFDDDPPLDIPGPCVTNLHSAPRPTSARWLLARVAQFLLMVS